MAEGIHATATKANAGRKNKYPLLIAGTAVILLVAGGLVQVLRPLSAFPAAGDGAPAGTAKAGAANQSAAPAKNFVGRVEKQMITYDELAAECVAESGNEVLESMINRLIIQQACDAKGIEVSAVEVNEEIVRIAKKFNIAVDQWLDMLKAERNVSPAKYRRDIIWPMLALRKLAGEQIKVTEADLEKAFTRNYGPRVKARAIVLDNQRRATEVWQKASKNPEDFGRLAKEHSIDPNSRALEGAIPPIQKFGGSPELEKAAFKLKPNEISGVIQIGVKQWVILLCEGVTEPIVDDRAQVEDLLKQELHDEKVQMQVAQVFEKLKSDARVDNYLTGVSSGGEKKPAATPAAGKALQVGGTAPAGSSKKVVPAAASVPASAPTNTAPRQSPTPGKSSAPAKRPATAAPTQR